MLFALGNLAITMAITFYLKIVMLLLIATIRESEMVLPNFAYALRNSEKEIRASENSLRVRYLYLKVGNFIF